MHKNSNDSHFLSKFSFTRNLTVKRIYAKEKFIDDNYSGSIGNCRSTYHSSDPLIDSLYARKITKEFWR